MNSEIKNFNFEEELGLSKEILDKLLDPSITLEESLKLYEKGLNHIKKAQQLIEEAKLKVVEIDQEFGTIQPTKSDTIPF